MTSSSAVAGDAAAGERAAQEKAAVIAGVLCYFFWGFFPLLFKAASAAGAGAWEMVAWRTVWALLIAAALTFATGRAAEVQRVLASRRTLGLLCLSGVTIGANWSLFVWAVNAGHTLDASLGYYLNPLLSVAAGLVLFRERIGRAGWTAIVLAAVGVAVQTVALGTLPFAALGMATSFCLYGVIRKHVIVDALTGFTFECVVLAGPALAYGLMLQASGRGHAAEPLAGFLMFLAGPASVAPLVTFAWAARRMPLSTMGFLQFISPTLQFFIALATGEPLKPLSLLAFAFIWAGVGVYAVTAWWKLKAVESLRRPSPARG
jgi:chloramphenicol-sensitive protein RarD